MSTIITVPGNAQPFPEHSGPDPQMIRPISRDAAAARVDRYRLLAAQIRRYLSAMLPPHPDAEDE